MGFEFDGKISIQRFQAAQTEVLRTRHRLPDEETAMFKHAVVHESLSLLKDALERLEQLIHRLHDADERCARAEEQLAHISEVNLSQTPQVAEELRAANQQRDGVSAQIQEVFDLIDEGTQRSGVGRAPASTAPMAMC
jgi:hypothetical protein